VLFFEAHAGGRQIGGVHQPHGPRLPAIVGQQRFEQMLVDAPQSGHPHLTAELMQHPHIWPRVPTTHAGKLSPSRLLRQHFDQQVHRMHRRKQTQQMHAVELGGGVGAMPAACATSRPARVEEVVGNERIEQFE
jgi:hypothetical protein